MGRGAGPARVAALSSDAQAVLGAAAVVGRRAPVALLVAATGRPEDDALVVLEKAVESYRAAGDGVGLGRVTAQIGHVHVDRGTPGEATERVQSTIAHLEDAEAWQGLAALHMTLARFFVASGRYQEQLSAATRAAALAHQTGDRDIVANAESSRGHALLLLGQLDEARRTLEKAVPLAEAVGDLDCLTATCGNLAAAHMWRGEFACSRRYVGLSIAAAERLGNAVLIMVAKLRRAVLSLHEGDWSQAHADVDWVSSPGGHIGGAWVFVYPVIALGIACFLEGDWERAERHLEWGIEMATRIGNLEALRRAQTWLAERDLREGRPADARDRLLPLLDRPEMREAGWRELDVSALLPRLAWAHLGLGDLDRATKIVEEGVGRARAQGHRIALADALWVRGMVAARQGRWEEAAAALDEGLEVARAMPYPYAEARILEAYGRMHLARGKVEAAREQLGAALAIFDRLGARKDAARVGQVLSDP